jgi:hypothetical protein
VVVVAAVVVSVGVVVIDCVFNVGLSIDVTRTAGVVTGGLIRVDVVLVMLVCAVVGVGIVVMM